MISERDFNCTESFIQQTLDKLYSLIDNAKRKEFLKNNYEFKLDTITTLLKKLGNPQEKFKIIHIAGTKGKGSCTHHLAAMLKTKNILTGHFLSPQIVDERDRFYIDHEKSTWQDIIYWIDTILTLTEKEKMTPTVFDIFTATAFCLFAEKKIEWAVIETGLGGRLDSTNVVNPNISIITKIGLDHTEILGDTLLKIAHEKGGIIKNNTPLFFQEQTEKPIEELFQTISKEKKSPCFMTSQTHPFVVDIIKDRHITSSDTYKKLISQLFSVGQKYNLTLCLRVMEYLSMPLSQEEFQNILLHYPLLARKQQWKNVLLDGAHNAISIRDLVMYVKDNFTFVSYNQIHLFFYLQPDKNLLEFLDNIPKNWQCSFVDLDLPYLPTEVKNGVKKKITEYKKFKQKIQILEKDTPIPFEQYPDTLFVVSGSFLLVGEFVRKYILH